MEVLENLKQTCDALSKFVICFSIFWVFISVAFAPPSKIFPAFLTYGTERLSTFIILGNIITLPNAVWILLGLISGSIASRIMLKSKTYFLSR
jgi:hypothetical protein